MQGTVKWFNNQKGYGFITDSDGKDVFVHHSNIVMDGFRYLKEDDIVSFELGSGNDGRQQAINVKPVLTMKMIEDSLKEEGLNVKAVKDSYGVTKYLVTDAGDLLQTDGQGISFLDLAAFTGYDIEGLSA